MRDTRFEHFPFSLGMHSKGSPFMTARGIARLVPLVLSALCAGCGGGSSLVNPPTTAVAGVVTLGGKPLVGATVALVPLDAKKGRSARGITDAEGKFSVSTYFDAEHDARGAVAGDYVVTITKTEQSSEYAGMSNEQAMEAAVKKAQEQADGAEPPPGPKSLIPANYGSPVTSEFKVTVGAKSSDPLKLDLVDAP